MTTTIPALTSNNSILNNYITQQQQAAANAAAAANTASGSSSTSGANTLEGVSGNFNTFLKILTTQLTNQDPTNATDTNQFTQELVEFSQVEQQLNTNSDLQQLINLQKNSSGLAATLNYIGKYVEAPTTSTFPVQGGQGELAYTLPSVAKSVTVTVTDSTGKTVATLDAPTTVGLDRVAWDGRDGSGNQLPDGVYNFQLSAADGSGNPITVSDTRAVGLVTAVQSNSDGTTSLDLGTGMVVPSSTLDAVYTSTSLPLAQSGTESAIVQASLTNGTTGLSYTLPSGVANTQVRVLDSNGNLVNTLSSGTSAGTNVFNWNGQNTSGTQLADGTYTFEFIATDANGNLLPVTNVQSAATSS